MTTPTKKCDECGGTGRFDSTRRGRGSGAQGYFTCTACDGTGQREGPEWGMSSGCGECNSTGLAPNPPRVDRRIIVCGSRDWTDRGILYFELDSILEQLEFDTVFADPPKPEQRLVIVHGACPFGGADTMAQEWADMKAGHGRCVTAEPHPAKFRGTTAFHARNQDMADLGAYLCIGFTDGRDPRRGTWGTGDMFSRALAAGIPIRGFPSRRPWNA